MDYQKLGREYAHGWFNDGFEAWQAFCLANDTALPPLGATLIIERSAFVAGFNAEKSIINNPVSATFARIEARIAEFDKLMGEFKRDIAILQIAVDNQKKE